MFSKKIRKDKNNAGETFNISFDKDWSGVGIYQISGKGMYGSKGKKVFGVNWSARGTQSVEETKKYMWLMSSAIEEVEKMNG